MLHFKIIGLTWLLLSLVAAAVFFLQLRSMEAFFVEAFLLAGAMMGFGLFRLRRWAAIGTRITAFLLLLYCLSFILMSHFQIAWLAVGFFGFAFAAYSLFVVWRFKPYDRAA